MKPECENCAEYASEFCKDCLDEKKIETEHSNCGTPDCCGECETADVTESATSLRTLKLINKIKKSGVVKSGSMKKEEMTTTASIPNPATTAMGPKFKSQNVTDRRRKKEKTVLLKRFRKYMEDNG